MLIRWGGLAKGVRFIFHGDLPPTDSAAQFGLDLFDEPLAPDCNGVGPTIVPCRRPILQRRLHPLAMSPLKFRDITEAA